MQQFAHIVSHNLRSHSGNISLLLDFLKEEYPEIAGNQLITYLTRASSNLNNTIKHLSEVAHVQTDEPKEMTPIHLHESIENAIANVIAFTKDIPVKLINEVNQDTVLFGYPSYVDSVLLNFITNAIKYRKPEGETIIQISESFKTDWIGIHVKDNGLGINMELHGEKIFGMFKTFHEHPDARGIGLFIMKSQVEAMGGTVEVESEMGKGSTFSFYLPRC